MVDTLKILGALLGGGGMSSGSGSSILGSVLGAATGGSQAQGGLGDLLSSVLGGSQPGASGQPGASAQPGGGLGDLLGSVLGGSSGAGSGPGLDQLLGGVLGGGSSTGAPGTGSNLDLGSLISSALTQFGNSEQAAQNKMQPRNFEEHSPHIAHSEAGDQATLMIRAMINAAKADGRVDKQEQEKILGKLGNVTQDELDFLRAEMSAPLDVNAFVRSVPAGIGNQVYAMSLMAVDLDTNPEAKYLHQLAQGLGISPEQCNQIHRQLGAPALYA